MKPSDDFPRMLFHRTKEPVTVHSREEEEALGAAWSRRIWPPSESLDDPNDEEEDDDDESEDIEQPPAHLPPVHKPPHKRPAAKPAKKKR